MVFNYNPPPGMFRQQPNGGSHQNPMHHWYVAAGYHQTPQIQPATAATVAAAAATNPYCMMQDDQNQMWHHPAPAPHSIFNEYHPEYMQHHNYIPMPQHLPHHAELENQLPSPSVTASGSEMSSPGAGSNASPPGIHGGRPTPVRSPYEWIKKQSYQNQPNPGKTRTRDKYRVVYTDHQRIELEKEFMFHNKYITIRRKSELAMRLGLSERQIKIWFQNRRAKERKQFKKRVEEKSQSGITDPPDTTIQNYRGGLNQHVMHTTIPEETTLTNIPPQHNIMHRYPENQHGTLNDRILKLELSDDIA